MPGSPALPIARPEVAKITLSPRIVAVSVAERYVADLVGQCQGIASLFEIEVPTAVHAVESSTCPVVLSPIASTRDGSGSDVADDAPYPACPEQEPSLQPSGTPEVQALPPTHSARQVLEARASAYIGQPPAFHAHEPGPWGGHRASESMRLIRLLDPEFRRRSTNQRQSHPHALALQDQPAAADVPASPSSSGTPTAVHAPATRTSVNRRHTQDRPGYPRRRTNNSSPHVEFGGEEVGPHKMSESSDAGYLHNALRHLHKLHENPEDNPSRASRRTVNGRMSTHPGSPRNTGYASRHSKVDFRKMRSKSASLTKKRSRLKSAGTFDEWDARRAEAHRHQLQRVEVEDVIAPPVLESDLQEDLRQYFRETCHKGHQQLDEVDDNLNGWELHQLALELQMSVDDVLLVKSVFDTFDDNRSGTLDIEEFELAVNKLLYLQLRDQMVPTDRVKSMCEWYWWDGDKDNSGNIDFREFLRWYSSNGFNEDLLLTEQQRCLRKIAKQHKVSADYVEHIKRCFDLIDTDHSNEVDINEFKQVLYKALKVPTHLELPPSRVQYFWQEIDTDGSGQAGFEEFFSWWVKYFDAKGDAEEMPFEAFYKQIRRVGAKYLDPPAYPPKVQDPDISDEDLPDRTWLERASSA